MNIITPVVKRFLCQHRNGDTFATNPTTDFVPYVQGEIIEKLKFYGQYTVQTVTSADVNTQIQAITSGSYVKLVHPYNNWSDEGFVQNTSVYITHAGNNTTGTVSIIFGNEMFLTAASFFTNLGITDGDFQSDLVIYNTSAPDTIRFQFGLQPTNSLTAGSPYASLLNGEDQLYTGSGLSGSPTTLDYAPNPATDLGSVDVTYNGSSGTANSIFTFTVEHIFRVPHFIAIWLTNYLNGGVPYTFQGNNSYNYLLYLNFGNNINNPNEGKIFTDFAQLGSIGFVGQNFNTGSSDYSFVSNEIQVNSVVVDKPEITATNVVSASIYRASGNFTAGVKAYLYVSKLPSEDEYTDSANTYEENYVLDQLDVLEGAGQSSSSIITNFEANINGGDAQQLDLDFRLSWSTTQQTFFNPGDYLFVGVIVENGALTSSLSDRTLVKLYAGQVDKDGDVSGLISSQQINVYDTTLDLALATPKSNFNTWNNRAYILTGTFRNLKEAGTALSPEVNSLVKNFKVMIVGRIPSTNTYFKIDEYIFPFSSNDSNFPAINIDNTYYQTNYINTTRQLGHVKSSAELRKVILQTQVPGSFQAYQQWDWQLGIEIPHREWIQNLAVQAVAPEFFDINLPDEFFNFNQRASNYSGVNSYEIYAFAVTDIFYDGKITTYAMATDQCEVADFDTDVIGTGWSAVTEYLDIFDNVIDTAYEGEDLKVRKTYTHPASAASKAEGEIVFEYEGETGQTHRLSSEVNWSATDNALEGESGTPTLVTVDQPNTTTTIITCYVKGEFLFNGTNFNTYGHLLLGP